MTSHRLSDDVVWRVVDGDVVALDFQSARYLSTNASGARLWPLLVRGATVQELAALLAEEHRLEPARARADVERWLASLRELGVLAEDPTGR